MSADGRNDAAALARHSAGFHGSFRRSMTWLHTWVGMLAGAVLFFMFVTGTTGYAVTEIDRWMSPEAASGQIPRPVDNATTMFTRAYEVVERDMPDASYVGIAIPAVPEDHAWNALSVYAEPPAADPEHEGHDHSGSEAGEPREPINVQLDPVTYQEVSPPAREIGGGHELYAMHFALQYIPHTPSLFGEGTVGWSGLIVSSAAMFLLISVLTGIVAHRRLLKDLVTFRPRRGPRSWLDAHNLASVLALPFVVMITYSGLIFMSSGFMPSVDRAAYGRTPTDPNHGCDDPDVFWCSIPEATGRSAPSAPIEPMIETTERLRTDGPVMYVTIYNRGDEAALVTVETLDDMGEIGGIVFNGITGEIIRDYETQHYDDLASRTQQTLLSLHTGTFAGPLLRWAYLLAGAAGSAMIATGMILWAVRRRERAQRRDGRASFGLVVVERATVGVVVGLLIAVASYFWANRLLPYVVDDPARWEIDALFVVWGLTFLHASLRPTRTAYREQLIVLAFVSALVPLVNVWTSDLHLGTTLFGGASRRDWGLAAVDLTLLTAGVIAGAVAWRMGNRVPRVGDTIVPSTAAPGLAEVGS